MEVFIDRLCSLRVGSFLNYMHLVLPSLLIWVILRTFVGVCLALVPCSVSNLHWLPLLSLSRFFLANKETHLLISVAFLLGPSADECQEDHAKGRKVNRCCDMTRADLEEVRSLFKWLVYHSSTPYPSSMEKCYVLSPHLASPPPSPLSPHTPISDAPLKANRYFWCLSPMPACRGTGDFIEWGVCENWFVLWFLDLSLTSHKLTNGSTGTWTRPIDALYLSVLIKHMVLPL